MCIVQKKIADNLLKAVQMYFNANPNANVYPLDVHISADTSNFLEDNGYISEQQENGRTKIIRP